MHPVLRFGAALAAAGAGLLLAGSGALAATGRVSAQYQGYSAPGGQDPYAQSNPQDVHVQGYGGQPVVTGYVKLNLDSLPSGSAINGLQLKLVPNSSPSDNVNSGAAAIQACPLQQALGSSGYQASPPSYDCGRHVNGEPQADGSWAFELSPIATNWSQTNNGMALVAYGQTGTPAGTVAPSAWSVAFDHTKTTANVDYAPGQSSTQSFFAAPVTAGSGASAVPAGSGALPVLKTAPLPAPASGSTSTGSTSAGSPASGQGTQPTLLTQPRVQKQWVWLTAALVAAALLMVLVGAGQHALRTGKLQIGAALAASRSQLATPVAVLALAAVFALGSTSQLATVVVPGHGVSGSTAGPGAAGPGTSGSGAAPGSGSGGAAAGSTGSGAGSSGAAAASTTNGGQDGPGVTSTTVRIGFTYVTNAQSANQAFGIKVPSQGNEQSEEQAMVDYVNKHGGIAGRQIQPVFVAVDNSQAETNPHQSEDVCHTFTEDYHVFAVVAGAGPPDDAAADACYAQAGTMNLDAGLYSGVDQGFVHQASPYIWFPQDATLDHAISWEIAGLKSRGFFGGGATYKLGVVIAQDPVNERVFNQVTLPALQAAGVSKPDTFEVPHDTVSDIANTMKQAVIHFQADGVTNVIFQGGNEYGTGSYAVLFMLDAESQHYTPRYGLSTSDAPQALVGNVPEDQLHTALAVGWSPGADTDDQHYGAWPSTPSEKKCAGIESAAGNTASTRESALAIMAYCDSVLQLQQAAQPLTGQALNAQLWADQAMKLGSAVFSASDYGAAYSASKWDAAGGYRWLHETTSCGGSGSDCFVYDNSTLYH